MTTAAQTNSIKLIPALLHSTALTRSAIMLSLTISALFMSNPAHAVDDLELPSGATVVGGSANFNYAAPGQLNVNQGTDRLVVDWNSFNIGAHSTTTFVQPNSNSLAVNRVTGNGNDPTQILGTLKANGRVMVLDQNGVLFGANSRVDVGGIIASTGQISTSAVMSGTDHLELSGFGNAAVDNRGDISVAEGGLAALVAPTVRNSGTITARLGRVALAAGDNVTVDLYGDNLIEMALDSNASKAVIEQTGTINAEGGLVQISARAAKGVVDNVINLDGVTTASSVTMQGGRIVLSGDTININGVVSANGTKGGSVTVDARRANMASTARVSANSTANSTAGNVLIHATENLAVAGTVEAKGAAGTGHVDTSAANIDFADSARVMATGEWVIDPTNITIGAVLEFLIELQLNNFGNAFVITPAIGPDAGNITVEKQIDWSTSNTLFMSAINDIRFTTGGINATGTGNAVLNAGRNISVTGGSGIRTNGGNLSFTSQRFKLTSASVNANGGNIVFNNSGGFQALANSIKTSGSGTIDINQNKDADAFLATNTVQNAINAISNTGTGTSTLHVGAGTWAEDLVVDRALILLGNNHGTAGNLARVAETLITPVTTGFKVTAANVTIDGFKVDGGSTGILVDGANNTNVRNNIITNTKGDGVLIKNVSNSGGAHTYVQSNFINGTTSPGLNSGSGVQVLSSAYVDVGGTGLLANTINQTGWDGVRVDASYGVNVVGNHISNVTRTGIYGGASTALLLNGNDITSAGMWGMDLRYDNGLSVTGNTIVDTALDGMYLLTVKGLSTVDGNTINRTGGNGIYADDTSNLHITNNLIGSIGNVINGDGVLVKHSANASGTRTSITGNVITGTISPADFYGSGIQVQYSSHVDVGGAGLLANTISNTGWDAVRLYDGKDINVVNNTGTNLMRDGVYATGVTGLLISDNKIDGTNQYHGIEVDNSENSDINNNVVQHTHLAGVNLTNLRGLTTVDTNTINNTGSNGIQSDLVSNLHITNNLVGSVGNVINGDGVLVKRSANAGGTRTTITGNTITNTTSPGLNSGSGVQVLSSAYVDVGGTGLLANTINQTGWDGVRVDASYGVNVVGNHISNVTRTGIYGGASTALLLNGNDITSAGMWGMDLRYDNGLSVTGNTIVDTALDGMYLLTVKGLSTVDGNTINRTGGNGIYADDTSNLHITNNLIGSIGNVINGDGVLVKHSANASGTRTSITGNVITGTISPADFYGSGIQVQYSSHVDVGGAGLLANTISNTGWDAVRLYDGKDINVVNNTGTNLMRDGVYATGVTGLLISDNKIDGTNQYHGLEADNSSDVVVTGNTVSNTHLNGINLTNLHNATLVSGNTLTTIGRNGIDSTGTTALEVADNTVNTAAGSGVYIRGAGYAPVTLHGNTVTGADVGMTFESGLIDLQGDTNTLNGGSVGYRFAPIVVKGGFSQVDLAGDTIGTTAFSGQSTYYVQLSNGALFAPGTPTLEDGLNATYDGFNPALTGGLMTFAQLNALEDMFYHYNDDNTLGLFFLGTGVANINQNRIFREDINSFAPGTGRAGFTITGLPQVPGNQPPAAPDVTNPADLNALAPAAGGDNQQQAADPTPEQLAALAPAAGGENTACWSDAVNVASGGQTASYSFSSDPLSALNDATSCGTPNN